MVYITKCVKANCLASEDLEEKKKVKVARSRYHFIYYRKINKAPPST